MPSVTISPQLDKARTFESGQEVLIPFQISSDAAVQIDGLQVSVILSGVPVTNVKLVHYPEVNLSALSDSATSTGAQAMLVANNPFEPLNVQEPLQVFGLSFTPEGVGSVNIQFVSDETIVAEHGTSQNILTQPNPISVQIVEPVTETQKVTPTNIQEEAIQQETGGQTKSLMLARDIGIGTIVIILLIVVGYLYYRYLRKKSLTVQQIQNTPQPQPVPPQQPQSPPTAIV
jgi:hypothetical protein